MDTVFQKVRFFAVYLLHWTFLVLPLSVITGTLVALFLFLLEKVTNLRYANGWLLFLLPLSGILIYFLYRLYGKNAEAGNNLIIDEIHEPGGGVPPVMTPLVLLTTIITHLFGGSAGREGTAVQMGGSMASMLAKRFSLTVADTQLFLLAGMAAGFGAVFGTPWAGAIFAIEVIAIGSVRYRSFIPCLLAAWLADFVCKTWGIHHTAYAIHLSPGTQWFSLSLLGKTALVGIACGLVSAVFAKSAHLLKKISNRFIQPSWLIPLFGGIIIILLTYVVGTRDFLGLGVTSPLPAGRSIVSAFTTGGVQPFDWAWKMLFTIVTLSMGFKGGEVTPLFFIGAALGCAMAGLLKVPADLFAGLGLLAVFAGATNTPVACTVMGMELFGPAFTLYFAVACFGAYCVSGHSGIYPSQRIARPKYAFFKLFNRGPVN